MAQRIPPKKPHRKLPLRLQKKKQDPHEKKTNQPTNPNNSKNNHPQQKTTSILQQTRKQLISAQRTENERFIYRLLLYNCNKIRGYTLKKIKEENKK